MTSRIVPLLISTWLATSVIAQAQLTVSDNLRFREDDFDLSLFGAGNEFGAAIVACDFDGNGFQDLAIGSPYSDYLGLLDDAGAVHVAYSGPDGLTLSNHDTLSQPALGANPPEAGDRFGSSLAAGDFDGDGRCDLAVASPGEALPAFPGQSTESITAAGAVDVFLGTNLGFDGDSQQWTQESPGVPGDATVAAEFGRALAAGDFDGDDYDDLAIGASEQGGSVTVLFGSSAGLTAAGSDLIYQGDPLGTLGVRHGGDRFARALTSGRFNDDPYHDLAIGAPGDPAGIGRGTILVLYGQAAGFAARIQEAHDQATFGDDVEDGDWFGSSLASGDFDGNGVEDLAIGAQNEDLGLDGGGEAVDAGSVSILYASPTGLVSLGAQTFTQESPGMSDSAEYGDRFSQVTAGDFDADGFTDLAIGAYGEGFEGGGHTSCGAVHVIYGSPAGLSAAREQYHGQAGWNVGANEDFDGFGTVLATGEFRGHGLSSLVIGSPFEGLSGEEDAGLVSVITGIQSLIFRDGFETGNTSKWGPLIP